MHGTAPPKTSNNRQNEELSNMTEAKAKSLTPETIASFTGWDKADVQTLVTDGWELDAIRRGIQHGMESPAAFSNLSLWSQTYLMRGHLWGDEPSETVQLAAYKIPDEGKVLEVGFGYGRDLIWLAQRRGRVMGIEKSRVGMTIAMHELRRKEHESSNGSSAKLGDVELIYGSMKSHRFAKGSLSGIFSHRTIHLPHPEHALPDIVNNMADAVKPGGLLVISARSVHDFYQDQDKMDKVLLNSQGYPLSAERIDRPGHAINYFTEQRFAQVFGPSCHIRELYIGKEPESLDNIKDGEQVYSYYMTAVMEVKPESERALPFGQNGAHNSNVLLPPLKRFQSVPEDENLSYPSLKNEVA